MSIQHKNIPDAQLHEPKGVASASAGEAYIADGAGSGDWKSVQLAQCAGLRATTTGDTTGITTSFKEINNAAIGGTLTWALGTNSGLTLDTTFGYIQVAEAGTYKLDASISFEPASATSVWEFTVGVDSGSGIVSKEASVKTVVRTAGTTSTTQAVINWLPALAINDKVYLMVRETTTGHEFEIVSLNYNLVRAA